MRLTFRKKTGLDEDFVQQQKITSTTKGVCEVAVKQFTPGSGGLLGFGKTKGGSEEEKKGDSLIEAGTKLRETSGESYFGQALISLGNSLRRIGEAHTNADLNVMENVVTPLKNFMENALKQVSALEKRTDSAASHVTTTRKAMEKKNDTSTQDAFKKAEDEFEEAKVQYFNAMRQVQETEYERVIQVKSWVEAQLQFHETCVSILRPLADELGTLSSQKANVAPPKTRNVSMYGSSDAGGGSGIRSPTAPPLPPMSSPKRQCRALYEFLGQTEKELTFSAGDILTIHRDLGPDWLEGEIRGSIGIFPTNYVEML